MVFLISASVKINATEGSVYSPFMLGMRLAKYLIRSASTIVIASGISLGQTDASSALFEKGYEQIAAKQFEQAVVTFRQYSKIEPDDPAAYFNVGTAYYHMKRYDLAAVELQTAVKMKPDYARAWRYLGGAYFNLKRFNDAANAYRNAVKHQKDYVDAYVWLGASLEQLQKYDEAMDAYEMGIEYDTTSADAWFGVGSASFNSGKYPAAISAFKKWNAVVGETRDSAKAKTANLYLGHAYLRDGQLDTAISAFMRVIAVDPTNAKAIYGLGEAYVEMKEAKMANIQKNKLDRIDPALGSRLGEKIFKAGLR